MNKRIALVSAVAAIAIAAPAAAWHVDTGKDQQDVRVTDPTVHVTTVGPKADPYYRVIVRVTKTKYRYGACTGWVRVPDRSWADGWQLVVDGQRIGRGERQTLPAGAYVGAWRRISDGRVLDEVERFTIACVHPVIVPVVTKVPVVWRYNGKHGVQKMRLTLREGCTWKSPWRWVKGDTMQWLKVGQQRKAWRTAAPGYYGPMKRITPGTTCR